MLKIEYTGERDITVRSGGWNTVPFKLRATSESSNPARRKMSRTWHFEHEGIEYRVQIQEVKPAETEEP